MTFYMMVGLSGSGKSSLANKFNTPVFSSDAIREEVFGNVNDQKHNQKVFEILHKRIIECLKQGKDCVYDATNLSAKRRKAFLNSISHLECEKICIVMATPFEDCVRRDKNRERTVGHRVIFRQMTQFQLPQKHEGWDKIRILEFDFENLESLDSYFTYSTPHDCTPYHLESIQQHLLMTRELAEKENVDSDVAEALLFHDVGKVHTKTFKNTKGELCDVAHYYGHENVSAYLYLTSQEFALNYPNGFEVASLIQFHMEPYKRTGESWEKFKKNFDKDFIEKLELVHKFDKLGRKTEED